MVAAYLLYKGAKFVRVGFGGVLKFCPLVYVNPRRESMKIFYHKEADGHCSAAVIKYWLDKHDQVYQNKEATLGFFEMNYNKPFPFETIYMNETIFIVDYSLDAGGFNRLLDSTRGTQTGLNPGIDMPPTRLPTRRPRRSQIEKIDPAPAHPRVHVLVRREADGSMTAVTPERDGQRRQMLAPANSTLMDMLTEPQRRVVREALLKQRNAGV